jgi:dipeptidyl aminopeptidase/acylaminoacyl peptidase
MAVPFDQNSMKVTGEPTALVEGMRLGAFGSADLAVSDAGTLVYATGAGQDKQELVWVSRNGKVQSIDPDWQSKLSSPALSPDGKRLAIARRINGQRTDIWIKQLDRGPSIKLSLDGNFNSWPTWTADGKSVTFSSDAGGSVLRLWTKRADGTAQAVMQLNEKRDIYQSLWSPDGKWLVYSTDVAAFGEGDILGIRPGIDAAPRPLMATKFIESAPALSPDGRWLAYTSNEYGDYENYVVPFPNTGAAKWVVSTHGGMEPMWSHSGRELFYRDGARNLVAVQVKTTPTFSLGLTTVLFPTGGFNYSEVLRQYDVSADDRRFLMIRPVTADASANLIVVENWFEELKAKSRK